MSPPAPLIQADLCSTSCSTTERRGRRKTEKMTMTYGTETKGASCGGHLHAPCRTGCPHVVRGARPVRCAHAFCPDLRRANIRVPHVGGRALGDDLRSVRGAAERGACTTRGRILGALLRGAGGLVR